VTPQQIQQLAQKYLGAAKAWRLSVVPEGNTGGR
jgi:predicted Zn-dependent peptidase